MAAPKEAPQLSKRQQASLKGVIDSLFPPLGPPSDCKEESSRAFWTYRPSVDPHFVTVLQETILTRLDATESFLLRVLFYMLSTLVGTALVFSTLKPFYTRRAFSDWTPEEQSQAFVSLNKSRFEDKRKIFNGLKRLICGLAFSFVPENASKNPFWDAVGYQAPDKVDEKRLKESNARDFRLEKEVMIEVNEDKEMVYDVVVVGSGAGGGVAAATLAAKGYSVLVLEKGSYVAPSQVNYMEAEAFDKMYQSHALLTTSDNNMLILAGSTLGGGTTINWSCCLPLPDMVREEWVDKHHLKQFAKGKEFDMATDAIMNRLECKDKSRVTHNCANQTLINGCTEMGYKWETTRQNLKNTTDETSGYICFGDRYGNKRGCLSTWLADAVDHGAHIMENCRVDQVIQGLYEAPNGKRRRRAMGVKATVGSHTVKVKANRCVIVAAGALNTPCLLLKSWLCSPHIGRHLHLHPVIAVSGFYDKPIECYKGAPMTSVCQEFASGPQNDGYGAKIEIPSAHPGLLATGLTFVNAQHYREHALRLQYGVPLIVLQRDVSEGRIGVDSDGHSPKVDYSVTERDKQSMYQGLKAAVKILIASGAKEIMTSHLHDGGLVVDDKSGRKRENIEEDPKVQQYLAGIDKRGFNRHEMCVFCAHQMGSCRMGISPDCSAVDENGETWEVDDLFVFDTSVFPTASGSNPMLTVLAISRMLSTRLLLRLLHEDGKMPQDQVSEAMKMLRLARMSFPQSSHSLTGILLLFLVCLMPTVFAWYFWHPSQRLQTGEL